MSRRRKHGDSPGLKSTPRKAAEECSSVVEPGKRRLRSARGSGLRGAGEATPVPLPQQEQPPAAAWCSKSNPEERYETPDRVLKMDLLSSSFNSPNDPDGLNDIFWDQNSPMTKQLGKGRKKQIYITDSDEISHIVSRIAPQDEKPTANSMLGMWIGETAIPCTPSVAKGKSRAKISCTKLKTQNREEELMKLAKQFDKNMEELDMIQEQHKKNHDFIQTISETKSLSNYEDNLQMELLCDVVPEIDTALVKKKAAQEKTNILEVNDQTSSQKPFDQNAEAALNAIFDGSTQKCSGQLSQDVSLTLLNTSSTTFGKKSILKEEKIIADEIVVTEKLANKTSESSSHPIMTQSCVASYTTEAEAFNKHTNAFTTSDFEDEWENLLGNEPVVLQNNTVPELSPVSKTVHIADQKKSCAINNENDKSRLNSTSLDAKLKGSKILQDVSSKTQNSEFICNGKDKFSLNPSDKPNTLSSTGNKIKFEKSFNKITVQDKFQGCTVASNLTKIKEGIHTKFTSNVNASEKNSTLNIGYSNVQKNKLSCSQSFKTTANTGHFGTATLDSKTSVHNPNQTNTSKLGSFFDDWNDPSFANEIIKACHQLENTWEADDVDDDLLYQACDDIEKLTQQQGIRKDSRTSEGIVESHSSSKHEARNVFTSKQEGQSVQSHHVNLSSISARTSSLTNSPQIKQSVKMGKKEVCGNSPTFLGATTNLTLYSNNSTCQTNNLHISWNNTSVPIKVSSSKKSVLTRSLSVGSNLLSTEMLTSKNLNTQHISCQPTKDEAPGELNRTVRSSKYTFTKVKSAQDLCQFNQNCGTRNISDTKIMEKNRTVSPLRGDPMKQPSLVKLSESSKQPSKEEEEKNRKYSPEEIQRKRQEALVRRMSKAQASSIKGTPT